MKDQYRKELTNEIEKQIEQRYRKEQEQQMQQQMIVPDNNQYNYMVYQERWYHRLFNYNNTIIALATVLTTCSIMATIKLYKKS